ncbi:MAG: SpoIIE family protein phosphatase [Microcoleaceae cyanobacterium]
MKLNYRFFQPAINFLNTLNYPRKFILISLVFALPLVLMISVIFAEINTRIAFIQKEIYGTEYLRPLRKLRDSLSQSQLLNYRCPKNLDSDYYLPEIKVKIEEDFKILAQTNRKLGSFLNTEKLYAEIYEDWQNFHNNCTEWSSETYDYFYRYLLLDVNHLSSYIGDRSNLILDSELDTYYLVDLSVNRLPKIQMLLSKVRLIFDKIYRQNFIAEEKNELIFFLEELKQMNQDLALKIAENFYQQDTVTTKFLQELKYSNNLINDFIKKIYNLNFTPQSIPLYIDLLERNRNMSFEIWDQAIHDLDILLQKRSENMQGKRRIITVLMLIILMLIIYLFTAFYMEVMQTVSALDDASKKMAMGKMNETIILDNKDELGQVVRSFNNIAIALMQANDEIIRLNEQLKSENVRMSAELDVTRKLQYMLLPKEPELQGFNDLDIAGFMESANEVGGDYYDVISGDNSIKIVIGDVTGHGLESGVLMIMAQTAVRTLLANDEKDPVQFLSAVNYAIYHNLHRMNIDKNMSLSILDYHNKNLTITGQHETVIVMRAHGELELIDTIDLGFPIGLEENISAFIGQISVQLNIGDVVVLYTDGITEAENDNKVLYGIERLIDIIKKEYHQTTIAICQAIIDDVRRHIGSHTVYDDITLVVIKQK